MLANNSDMFIRIRYKSDELYSQRLIPYTKKKEDEPDYVSTSENIDFFIEFSDEELKNELGNNIKILSKQINQDQVDTEFYEHYSEIEMKYRVAKVIESKIILFSNLFLGLNFEQVIMVR